MSEPPPDPARAAPLLERLLEDPGFREEFRRDPADACRRLGVPELGAEVASRGKALQTLDLRESRSSLAGALAAMAAEAIGVLDLIDHARHVPDSETGRAMTVAMTRLNLRAVPADHDVRHGLAGSEPARQIQRPHGPAESGHRAEAPAPQRHERGPHGRAEEAATRPRTPEPRGR